ncbi:hypothetical protein TTHERM_00149050 (macronuclear) [Tetrahymena thermophila SB210]|uniref:Uncharacterized protein n=1 Tax=Tetrahymena thermophila (strain SB210) TaxID=312017 RepID=I7MGB0_TETTS|nr:hypothetical protein TTHERM_00149050 [Tetrahymena thermophila SB210]EAS01295.2 hypothetical protein TTHERM_00149050 [Tetrahymena thermophila SB210]|eukprot:XP_001021540.2 hypothetical protein TTHERM_00149050 [Tetrahymena thermophila SB210]
MSDSNDQDNLFEFEAYQLQQFDYQDDQSTINKNTNYSNTNDDLKDRKVKVEFTDQVIRFNPKETVASSNITITNQNKANGLKIISTGNTGSSSLNKEDNNDLQFKKSQKVKKLQTEYKDHIETQQALKEFQDKEYQFRFIIDNFIQVNNFKQQQLESQKQLLYKLQNSRYTQFDKSDPLLHINNNNNLRTFANQKINKYDEYYPEEIEEILCKLKDKIQKIVDKVKEEQFYTKTLCHMEQRLILQKEEVQKLQLEYEELNEAVEKNIAYLEDDEKETKAQNTLNVCKQQYVKKAMNHIEEIHKTVMQKTNHLQQIAETDLKLEIDQYKDIKESLVEANEILKETQQEIEYLGHQHMLKLKQQQDLDSLLNHLGDFDMLARVFIYDDPANHFNSQMLFEPKIDFSILDEENEVVSSEQQKNNSTNNKSVTPKSSNILNQLEEKNNFLNLLNSNNYANHNNQSKYTQKILKSKNLLLHSLKLNKKPTQIKNDLDSDEAKAQFIILILNQFYEFHNNDITGLFNQLQDNYIYACKLGDNLSAKVIQLEMDKKKYQEELISTESEAEKVKKKFYQKKKKIDIMEVDKELDQYSYNQIISSFFVNDQFLDNYYNSEDDNPNLDIYQLLKQNEIPQQSSFQQEQDEFKKFFSLLNQIRDRGDGQNQELNDLVDESIMFLRGWKVESKELDSTSRYLIVQEMKKLNIKYLTSNILTEKNILDCLTLDVGDQNYLFGILKIFDKSFKDRFTLKQICERISKKLQSKAFDEQEKQLIQQNIETIYQQSKDFNIKRCKDFFLEIIESHCFIYKYTTKAQLLKLINDTKQQYDSDLEEYLLNNQDFKEGNQKINIDENHIIRIFLQKWDWIFEKACNRAREWIYDIMSLFKKVLMIILRRKMILSKQLGLMDWYDEEGVLHHWYDPVNTFNTKQFDQKLNQIISTIHSNKSKQISMYLGKHFESTLDTFQCTTLDTQIPIRTNKKNNIFSIVKEQVDYMEQGEEFINIKDDLIQFETDRIQIKKIVDQVYRPSSAGLPTQVDEEQNETSIGASNINSNETGSKRQRAYSANKGDENSRTKTTDLSVSGQLQSISNMKSTQSKIIQQSNLNNSQQIKKIKNDGQNSVCMSGKKKRGSIIQNKSKKRKGGVSSAGEETAASMNDLPSGEYQKKQPQNQDTLKAQQQQQFQGLLNSLGVSQSNTVKNKILTELTKEIQKVDKNELKSLIQSERNNIVHQQEEYRKARDLYIKEKQFDEYHEKLSAEIQKQIVYLQQQISQANNISPQTINQLNQQMQQLQAQFQRLQLGGLKSVPAQFKKKQQSAIQVLEQQQAQLQQLQSVAYQAHTKRNFLSGTTSSNANTIQNQNKEQDNNSQENKQNKKKQVFLDILKEKWEKKEISKMQSQQMKGFAFTTEIQKDKEDLNNTKKRESFSIKS